MATNKTPKVESAADKEAKYVRRLTGVTLISSMEFAKLSAKDQTAVFADAAGQTIEVVHDFNSYRDRKAIRDKLLSGKDATRELEFNGIILSPEELVALRAVKSLLARVEGLGPIYVWGPEPVGQVNITFETNRIRRGGHTIAIAKAKTVWARASRFWSGGPKPSTIYTAVDGVSYSNKELRIAANEIQIGCQAISRAEVEYIARHYGWAPTVFEG